METLKVNPHAEVDYRAVEREIEAEERRHKAPTGTSLTVRQVLKGFRV